MTPDEARAFLNLPGRDSVEIRKPRCFRRTAEGSCARSYGHPGPCETYGMRRTEKA